MDAKASEDFPYFVMLQTKLQLSGYPENHHAISFGSGDGGNKAT